jgi:hypothetical protein
MLYLYHKRVHIGCFVAFLMLTVINTVILLSTGANISPSDDIGIILLVVFLPILYLIPIFFPKISYHIACYLFSPIAKRPATELRADTEIKKIFLRARFFPLLIEDFILLLIFLNLIPYLFK